MRFSTQPVREASARSPLLLLVLAAFAWRVQGLTNQSLWRDEVDAVYFALRNLPDTLSMFVNAGQNGPLYFLALRPWFHLAGATDFALRFPSAMFGALAVPLLFQVTRVLMTGDGQAISLSSSAHRLQLRHVAVPLLSATLLAANPYQLWYSQEGKMYSLVMALVLLATWWWLRGVTHGGWQPWLAYLLTVSIAMYCHLLLILLIPLHLLWFLIAWPQSRQRWLGYGLAFAGLTLPYLPMVWWQWDLLMAEDKRSGFNFTPLTPMARTLVLNNSRGFLPNDNLILLVPLFFLALAGLVLGMTELPRISIDCRALRLAAWRRWLLIFTWLTFPVVEIYLLSLRQPIFTDRYLIWIAPAALIFVALGALVLYRNAGGLGASLVGLFLLYLLGFWLYAGWHQKTLTMKYDLRGAIGYVAARRTPDTLLILQIPHLEYSYRYFTGNFRADLFVDSDARLGHWAPGLWTNNGAPDEQARAELDRQMRVITAGATKLWVIRSEVEMWDARHLMDEWLDQHGQIIDQAEFHGAQVKHYVMVNG